jgi:ribose transport system ATP-binding protein
MQGIAFVSGDRKREGILPNLSIFENLLFAMYRKNTRVPGIRFIDWQTLSDIFDWEVERLAIKAGTKSNLISSLSGGNQQKVIIGRALAQQPKILVLNDPARGIDVDTKRELYKHLREFAGEGNSVVYMSSELEEFIGFCSRVVVFRNGSIFETFVDEDVDPVGILEGMFGRVRGGRAQAAGGVDGGNPAGAMPMPSGQERPGEASLKPAPLTGDDVTHVKIVDFDKERQNNKRGHDRIKVSYFD